ncbi:immunity 32 family protein [Burkholderia pseudomallei]|uniref:immunity 52 family protein n=1 Tax=Burkholderia pseudomallei TaxID=28450 RepID=UPI00050F7E3B|nr:immunity 52 family protein [Burkholderia pseudomallei]KGD37138.1 immunity 32 family protein [Burkholderia pseudomallei]
MDISLQFKDASLTPTSFEEILSRIHVVTSALTTLNPKFNTWFAQGSSRDEAFLYPVFEEGHPTTAILAVLKQKFSKNPPTSYVALWDGDENEDRGATIACHVNSADLPNTFELSLFDAPILRDLNAVEKIVRATITAFGPAYVCVAPRSYVTKQVFDDKPGVGWMLYLPRVITQQQVPEARALIPVTTDGKKQQGTIIVSTTDAPFSMKVPEHVEVANRIEIRLVDQDLLPAFSDI